MRSYFYRYPAAAHSRKLLRHAFLGCGHAAFRKQLTVVSQRAIAAGLVSQVHADRDRPFFSSCCPFRTLLHGAILFHGRSPFALRVRLIGSLSHPAGGRPSHSISVTWDSVLVRELAAKDDDRRFGKLVERIRGAGRYGRFGWRAVG